MKRTFPRITIAITLITILIITQPVSADSQYTITDLGTLGGSFSYARAINDNMQIVGGSDTSTGERHAFIWENGVMTDLGTLGGSFSFASALNNLGQVVGISYTSSEDLHAFLWENGTMIDLSTLGGSTAFAWSINELGQVVGHSYTVSGDSHAFLWENGIMTDLGTLGGLSSWAYSINDLGQVVGNSHTSFDDSIHAFFWQNGVMTDLGLLAAGYSSYAEDINENQQIVGVGDASWNEAHAVLWENGTITDLGVLRDTDTFSQALSINGQMQIVGSSGNIEDWEREVDHAFLWEDGLMIDLGTLGGNFASAFDINSDGQIVGDSSTSSGENHAVLWALPTKVDIAIDIKPKGQPNSINLKSNGVIPVAVLTTDNFDANTLDPATVVFAGASPLRWSWQDVDWDGDIDLLFHFKTQELNLGLSSIEASLTGKTFDGISIEGVDLVKIVPNK